MSHEGFFNAGFGPLMLPVIPPNATISPNSTVTDAGKTPGKLGRDGWHGVNLKTTSCASLKEAKLWDKWGASMGFACGREGLVILDVDVGDLDFNEKFCVLLAKHGVLAAPIRRVDDPQHHKFAVLVRVVQDVTGEPVAIPSRDIRFGWKDQDKTAVQILGVGKQAVIEGLHAKTLKPYVTTPALTSLDAIPMLTEEEFHAFVQEFESALPAWGAKPLSTHKASAPRGARRHETETCCEEELREWLELVPNTLAQFPGRDEWVQMLYAIYGASEGAPGGKSLWLEWCEAVPQTPGLPEAYWDRIENIDEVRSGMSAIRHWARKNAPGKAAAIDFRHAPDADVTAMPTSGNPQLWDRLRERFLFARKLNRFIDKLTGSLVYKEALDTELAYMLPELRAAMPAGTDKETLRSFTTMLTSFKSRVVVDGLTYHPGKPRVMDGKGDTLLFNQWRPGVVNLPRKIASADVQKWLALNEFVWGGPVNAEVMLKWMAFVIQFPDRKPNWHPLLMSKQGIGKDTMLKPLLYALGGDNYASIGTDTLSGNFTQFLETKLVFVNEAKQRSGGGGKSSHDIYNDVKKYLAIPMEQVEVNKKGLLPYSIPNLTAWVFFSNEDNPLAIGEGDRRIFVVDNRAVDKKDPTYYADVIAWLDNSGVEKVAGYLLDYPLTAADIALIQGPAPQSAAKDALVALNGNPVISALHALVADSRLGVGPTPSMIVTASDLIACLKEQGLHASAVQLGRWLQQIPGCAPVLPDPRNPNLAGAIVRKGKGYRLWRLGDKDPQGHDLASLTAVQAAELYETGKWSFPAATVTMLPTKNLAVV